jgi:hypothetical protein
VVQAVDFVSYEHGEHGAHSTTEAHHPVEARHVCTEAKVGKRSARWGRDMEAEVQGRLWRVLKKSALPSAISVQTVVRVHMVLGERVESRCLPTVRFANQVLEEAGCELAEEDAAMNSAPDATKCSSPCS